MKVFTGFYSHRFSFKKCACICLPLSFQPGTSLEQRSLSHQRGERQRTPLWTPAAAGETPSLPAAGTLGLPANCCFSAKATLLLHSPQPPPGRAEFLPDARRLFGADPSLRNTAVPRRTSPGTTCPGAACPLLCFWHSRLTATAAAIS